MKTVLMVILMIAGMLMLANPKLLPLGLICMVAGWWVHERMTPRDEERFMGALIILGALGALITVVMAGTGWVRAQL